LHSLIRGQSVVSPQVGPGTLESAVAKYSAEEREPGAEPQLLAGLDAVEV
jgi:hypothetical protein